MTRRPEDISPTVVEASDADDGPVREPESSLAEKLKAFDPRLHAGEIIAAAAVGRETLPPWLPKRSSIGLVKR